MKLTYFELLSPDPIYVSGIGRIISPKLCEIFKIGEKVYQYYLNIISMDVKSFFMMINKPEVFEALNDEEKMNINIFDLMTASEQSIKLLTDALDFFIEEHIEYSFNHHGFITKKHNDSTKNTEIIGVITRDNYADVCDLICQRNRIKSRSEDMSKAHNQKTTEIMKKLKKGREKWVNSTKADDNMELGNIISAVANKSQSLNIINIWNLTLFQLWDCFSRLSNNNIYEIQSMSVATWGDKDKQFDFNAWFKQIG